MLTPDDSSVVAKVQVSEFILDHALVLGHLDFISYSVPRSKIVTFWRYHKTKVDSLRSDLANCLFVKALVILPVFSISNIQVT